MAPQPQISQAQAMAIMLMEDEERSRADPIHNFRRAQTPEEKSEALMRLKSEAEPISGGRRYFAKWKITEEGVKGNLEQFFDQVTPLGENNFAAYDKQGKPVILEDSEKLGVAEEVGRDILDLAPEIGETAFGVGGAILTGSPTLGGALGTAVGRSARHVAEASVAGESFPEEGIKGRAKDVAEVAISDLLLSGGIKGLGTVAGKAWRGLAPGLPFTKTGRISRIAGEFTEEGVPITKPPLGKPLTRAEMKEGTEEAFEDVQTEALYRYLWPKEARGKDIEKIVSFTKELKNLEQSIATGARSGERAVNELAVIKRGRVAQIRGRLNSEGNRRYTALREATGNKKVMASPQGADFLEREIRKAPETSPAAFKELRDQLLKASTVDDFIAYRGRVRSIAQGDWKIHPDWSETANRRLGNELMDRVSSDLDSLASRHRGEVGRLFKEANDFWRAGNVAIQREEETALALAIKAVSNNTPLERMTKADILNREKLVNKILAPKALTARHIQTIFKEADKIAPQAANDLRRAVISDLFKKVRGRIATPGGRAVERRGIAEAPVDLRKLAEFLESGNNFRKLHAILGPGPQIQLLKQLANAAKKVSVVSGEIAEAGIPASGIRAAFPAAGGAAGIAMFQGAGARIGAGLGRILPDYAMRMLYPEALAQVVLDPKSATMALALLKRPEKAAPGVTQNLALRLLRRIRLEDETLGETIGGRLYAPVEYEVEREQ